VEAPSKPRRARVVLALKGAALLIFLVLLARSLSHADWAGASARLAAIGPAALLVLLPFPLALTLDSTAWKLLLARVGPRVPLAKLFRVRVATESLTVALPAGGIAAEALAPFLVRPDAPMPDAIVSAAAKRWLIIRGHGYYVGISFAVGFASLAASSRALLHHDGLPWIVLATSIGLLGLSFALQNATTRLGLASRVHDGIQRLPRFFRRFGVQDLPRASFERVDTDLARIGKAAHPVPSALLVGAWLVESFETWLILTILGVDVPWVVVLSFDAALSAVRSAAAFAPAGLGAQDLGYLAFFEAYGIPNAAAIGPAFLLLKRSKELVWVTIGFTLLFFFSRRKVPA
jgi:hypothetical protein